MKTRILILLSCVLGTFACAPTKVRVIERESVIEKRNMPEKKPRIERTAPSPSSFEKDSPETVLALKPSGGGSYSQAISDWNSHQDLARWMEETFSFDAKRYKQFEGTLPVPRTPDETFRFKSGIYVDVAPFLKETLNRIDPQYNARVVILLTRSARFNHYVCSFQKGGKLFIMDYGTPYKEVTGIHGPYNSLEQYKKFYEQSHPAKRKVEAISYLR